MNFNSVVVFKFGYIGEPFLIRLIGMKISDVYKRQVEGRSATPEVKDFYGSQKAVIDKSRCTFCGACASNCRFDAIKLVKAQYLVDEYSCEGCGVCEHICRCV